MSGTISCPSAPCAPGARLIGMRGADGRIKNLRQSLEIDQDFIARASAQGQPEARMRFSSPCVEGKCSQWTGHKCGVIENVLARLADASPAADKLPPCSIRGDCRWFKQRGAAACHACDLVITDQTSVAAE